MSAAEAMLAGVPLVVSHRTGIAELIDRRGGGVLIDPNAESLAGAVASVRSAIACGSPRSGARRAPRSATSLIRPDRRASAGRLRDRHRARKRTRPMSSRPIRLAHLAGQPAPSAIPLYRRLAADDRIEFTVLYGSSEGVRPYDDGYDSPIAWDADLLEGYDSIFLHAADRTPGLGTHFWAARNWDVVPLVMRAPLGCPVDGRLLLGHVSHGGVGTTSQRTGRCCSGRSRRRSTHGRSSTSSPSRWCCVRTSGWDTVCSSAPRTAAGSRPMASPRTACSLPRTRSITRSFKPRRPSCTRGATSCERRSESADRAVR